jgi:hypothetical protein
MFQSFRGLESSTGHAMMSGMKDQKRLTKRLKEQDFCSFMPKKLIVHYICAYSNLIDILFKVPPQNFLIY